jgi:hypothetical protein
MASLNNQALRFFDYEFGTRENKPLTAQNIKDLLQTFKYHCEDIRKQALKGDRKYSTPRTKVQTAYLECKEVFNSFEKNIQRSTTGKLRKKKLLIVLEKVRVDIEDTYKNYRPEDEEKGGALAVEFVKVPMRENTTKYGGTGYKKVETSLDFEPAPFAEQDFIEQHRRKDPCNCTIL